MKALKDSGCEVVGLSSVGPSVAAITSSEEKVIEIATRFGMKVIHNTSVANEGYSLVWK